MTDYQLLTALEAPQCTYIIVIENLKCLWFIILYKKRESCVLGNTTEEGSSFSINVSFLYPVTPEYTGGSLPYCVVKYQKKIMSDNSTKGRYQFSFMSPSSSC